VGDDDSLTTTTTTTRRSILGRTVGTWLILLRIPYAVLRLPLLTPKRTGTRSTKSQSVSSNIQFLQSTKKLYVKNTGFDKKTIKKLIHWGRASKSTKYLLWNHHYLSVTYRCRSLKYRPKKKKAPPDRRRTMWDRCILLRGCWFRSLFQTNRSTKTHTPSNCKQYLKIDHGGRFDQSRSSDDFRLSRFADECRCFQCGTVSTAWSCWASWRGLYLG